MNTGSNSRSEVCISQNPKSRTLHFDMLTMDGSLSKGIAKQGQKLNMELENVLLITTQEMVSEQASPKRKRKDFMRETPVERQR